MSNNISRDTADELEATILPWRDRLLAIDAETAHHKPAADRWSIAEVIGHLIDSACNNHQRFVRAQESESLTFPAYDQNHWAVASGWNAGDWHSLVEFWYQYQSRLAIVIRNIPAKDLATPCTITPCEPCTLEFIVSDYVVHLRHHLAKIEERLV